MYSNKNCDEERIKKAAGNYQTPVITAEENERHALGLELHDNVNQLLATVTSFIGMARNTDIQKERIPTLDEADNLIDRLLTEIRNLSIH